ncbi:MAG: flagellar motor switch protein FliN [Spirochaetia bacterium]|nr:flagellar motor switch protein FliN [Spirochaetia bacterium]
MALNDTQKNSATEIFGNAVPNGEKMLSELLGKNCMLAMSQVEEADAGALSGFTPGRNLVAPVELGDGMGNVVLLISEAQAAIMADLMIGQDGSNPPAALEDLHLSAVTELANQVTDAIVSGIGSQIGTSLLCSPGEVTVVDMDSGVVPGIDGEVVLVQADLTIGDFAPGKLVLALSGRVANSIKEGPKAAVSAEGFVNDITSGGGPKMQKAATAQNVVTTELQAEKTGNIYDRSLDIVLDVPLQVTVELGRTDKLVRDVLELSPGSVIELDKLAGEPVDILVNQKYIAKGEVVVIDENFGIRITDIIRPADRIPKL